MIPVRFSIELVRRKTRGVDRYHSRYRYVIWRVSLDADGRPCYLRKQQGKPHRSEINAVAFGWAEIKKELGLILPARVVVHGYMIDDAENGEPVTERDALKFAPQFGPKDGTPGDSAAALDWLREQLEEQ